MEGRIVVLLYFFLNVKKIGLSVFKFVYGVSYLMWVEVKDLLLCIGYELA